MTKYHSPTQSIAQLREQLASDKRKLSFFFGAGTSMSVGIPGIFPLTEKITEKLSDKFKVHYENLKSQCDVKSVELILNKLRTIRELIGNSEDLSYENIKGYSFARDFDSAICKAIAEIVSKTSARTIEPHLNFVSWLFKYQSGRINPVEIFTTNYDLLFEEALEQRKVPYFDGFVGSINPFIVPECIDAENNKYYSHVYVPVSWLRLWKIHGSINWFLHTDSTKKSSISRNSAKNINEGDELMIYPSKQKYDESRRLPFLLYQDRLRKFLSHGEVLLIVSGYSFNDDHLNEILFQSLRSNKRLAVTALMFGEYRDKKRVIEEKILKYGMDNPNLTILGPDKACIGTEVADWKYDGLEPEKDVLWNNSELFSEIGCFDKFTCLLKSQLNS